MKTIREREREEVGRDVQLHFFVLARIVLIAPTVKVMLEMR